MSRYEWIIIELIVLGVIFRELWSLRRLRRDREAKKHADKLRPPDQA